MSKSICIISKFINIPYENIYDVFLGTVLVFVMPRCKCQMVSCVNNDRDQFFNETYHLFKHLAMRVFLL